MEGAGSNTLAVQRLQSAEDPGFQALLAMYRAGFPSSERKPDAQLAEMIARPDYLFLLVTLDGAAAGFSISLSLKRTDVFLLEYMAVDVDRRGHGLGRFLFRHLVEMPEQTGRHLLVEVDSDKLPSADRNDRVRRKRFYRNLGCREVEGFDYIMPPLSKSTPPAMDLMVYGRDLPEAMSKVMLREWVEDVYVSVYSQQPTDPKIHQMMENLPEHLRLI